MSEYKYAIGDRVVRKEHDYARSYRQTRGYAWYKVIGLTKMGKTKVCVLQNEEKDNDINVVEEEDVFKSIREMKDELIKRIEEM